MEEVQIEEEARPLLLPPGLHHRRDCCDAIEDGPPLDRAELGGCEDCGEDVDQPPHHDLGHQLVVTAEEGNRPELVGPRDPRHLGEQTDPPQLERGCQPTILQHCVESLHQTHLDDRQDCEIEFIGEAVEAGAAPPGGPLDLQLKLRLRQGQLHCLPLMATEAGHILGELVKMLEIWLKRGSGIMRLRLVRSGDMAPSKQRAKIAYDLVLYVRRVTQHLLLASWPRTGQPRQPHWRRPLRGNMENGVLLLRQGVLARTHPAAPKAVAILLGQAGPENGNCRPIPIIKH